MGCETPRPPAPDTSGSSGAKRLLSCNAESFSRSTARRCSRRPYGVGQRKGPSWDQPGVLPPGRCALLHGSAKGFGALGYRVDGRSGGLASWLHYRLGNWLDGLLRRPRRLSSGSGDGLDRLLLGRRRRLRLDGCRPLILDRFGGHRLGSHRLGSRGGDRCCCSLLGRIKRGRFRSLLDWRSLLLLNRGGRGARRFLDRSLSTVEQPLRLRRLARQEDAHQKGNEAGNKHKKKTQARPPTRRPQASVCASIVVATVHFRRFAPHCARQCDGTLGKSSRRATPWKSPHMAYFCG
jgi:hypothetical protein